MIKTLFLSPEWFLGASLAGLLAGPLLYRLAVKGRAAMSALDGFVVVVVLGLVLLEIMPSSLELAGWKALVAAVVGLLIPSLAEPRFGAKKSHRVATAVAVLGLLGHSFVDGMGLSLPAGMDNHSRSLGIAIVLHQLPVGLAVWMMLGASPQAKPQIAGWLLCVMAIFTCLGFYSVGLRSSLSHAGWGAFQAFAGGLLLHVVGHGSPIASSVKRASSLGGLAGLVFVGYLASQWSHEHPSEPVASTRFEFFSTLLDLSLVSAPALLIAFILAGLLGGVAGAAPARWLSRGAAFGRALRGVAFGLPLPLCSCGVVPVYRSLTRRKVPAAAALAFLVATPELGLDALLISWPLLGGEMAVGRLVAAFLVALLIGWGIGGWIDREQVAVDSRGDTVKLEEKKQPLVHRIRAGLEIGLGEIVDTTAPWILFGMVLAAFVQPWLDFETIRSVPPSVQVGIFAVLGMPTYVCATGATPLVAILMAKGLSPGAALAFLLTGPATNATTYGVLRQAHSRKVANAFVVAMIVLSAVLGMLVNGMGISKSFGVVELHQHQSTGFWTLVCAWILLGLFLASFLRQGPRKFLGHLWVRDDHQHGEDESCCAEEAKSSCCEG